MNWLLLIGLCAAINCKKHGIEYLDHVFTLDTASDTPPTVTKRTAYFNPCSPVNIDGCASDDHLCVISEVNIDGKDRIINVQSYGSQEAGATESRTPDGMKSGDEEFQYENAKWGDSELYAQVRISCGEGKNRIEFWGTRIELFIGSGVYCPDQSEPGGGGDAKEPGGTQPPGDKKKSHWGFFHWLFVLFILGAIGYALLTVYVNFAQSRGNIPLAANVSDVLRDLPYLVRDVIRKISSSFGSQSRSGYSAL